VVAYKFVDFVQLFVSNLNFDYS